MFDHYLLGNCKTSSSFSAIMSEDIIDMIKTKRASKLVVTVAVPSDDVLENGIHVGKRAYDMLQNVKKVGCSITFSARRFKNMFNNPEEVGRVVAAIKEEHGENLQGLKLNAKADGEESQVYDLLQHSLTHKVTFDAEDISSLTADDFYASLSACYRLQRPDLIRYIRVN